MLKSMTSFGRGVAVGVNYKLTVELKSVNNRYLEVVAHTPRLLLFLEPLIKTQVAQAAARGKVDVFVQLENIGEQTPKLRVDKALAAAYLQAAKELAASLKMPLNVKLTMRNLVAMPGLITLAPAEEATDAQQAELTEVLSRALSEALVAFVSMRELEGGRLQVDLLTRAKQVSGMVAKIEQLAEQVVADYQNKLLARIGELLPANIALDEARLVNEVAYFADRACINEELVRLQSHLLQLEELLQKEEPVGRKLDFLLQEINREVNTIGSKANYLAINQLVIEAKSELEKIREQVQNLE